MRQITIEFKDGTIERALVDFNQLISGYFENDKLDWICPNCNSRDARDIELSQCHYAHSRYYMSDAMKTFVKYFLHSDDLDEFFENNDDVESIKIITNPLIKDLSYYIKALEGW